MCNESDSGATRCCCRRKVGWACTACNTNFTRKNNAERHIRNVHLEAGGVRALGKKRPISDPNNNPSFFINSQSNFHSPGRKARQLLDEQSEDELKKILGLLKQQSPYAFVDLRGRVCVDCIKVVLEGSMMSVGKVTTIPRHECDPAWLFDQPFLLSYRHVAEKYLENKIAGMIMNILCRHGEKFVNVYGDEEKRLNTKWNQVYVELMKNIASTEQMKHTIEVFKAALSEEERDIQADINKNYVIIKTSEFPWCALFYDAAALRIKKEDALGFLAVTKRTTTKCRVIHREREKLFVIQIL